MQNLDQTLWLLIKAKLSLRKQAPLLRERKWFGNQNRYWCVVTIDLALPNVKHYSTNVPRMRAADAAFFTDEVKTEIPDRLHLAVLVFS